MKKTLALVLSVLMVLALIPMASAAPIEIDYWSVFTGADGATMQGMDRMALGEGLRYAIIVVSSIPMILLYPFFQRYFAKGVMIGAVKG